MPTQWNQQYRMSGTKHFKRNRLQKTIGYKTNEEKRVQNSRIELYK